MVRIIPFGVLLELWAFGQLMHFLLLLLGFTADVHTFCTSIFRQTKSFRIYAENFHPVVCLNGKLPRMNQSVVLSTELRLKVKLPRKERRDTIADISS